MAKMNLTEEQKEVKNLIIIILIVVGLLGLVYLFSRAFVSKDLFNKKKEDTTSSETAKDVTFNYTKIIVGELLNRPYSEYYVLAFDSEDDMAFDYNNMMNSYGNSKIKLYQLDLNDGFNKNYKSKESNPTATEIKDLKFSDVTLIKVKNGKIVKYVEGKDAIRSELNI